MENPVYALRMPVERRSCAVFSSPHSGSEYPAAFLAASQLSPLQIRSSEDAFVDELFAAAPGRRRAAPRRPGAARLHRPQPRRRRPRPGADRRRLAALPQRPHRRRPRGHPAGGRRGPADHAGQADAGRGGAADRATTGIPTTTACARSSPRRASCFGMAILIDCHSMPHDALSAAPLGLGPAAGRDPRRPLRRRLRALADRRGDRALRRRGLHRGAQRALRRRLHHPDLRPAARRGCRRCRSRSTARSTWTRRGSSGCRASPRSPRGSAAWSPGLAALGPRRLPVAAE